MDTFDSQPQSASHSSYTNDYDSAKDYDFNMISPVVQSHLKKVYATLFVALLISALGAYLHIIWNIGGVLTTVATFFFISTITNDALYEGRQGSEAAKILFMMLIALFQGASVGPVIKLAITINPGILVTAFVGTAIAFGCFSGAAMLARRRQYLYLGGMLSSGVSILLWVVFASHLFGGSFAFIFQVYFGLLLFVGYIVFDTQFMIEMADLGHFDYVLHALMLYIDFIAVFVRILVIMLENEKDRDRRKRRSRRE